MIWQEKIGASSHTRSQTVWYHMDRSFGLTLQRQILPERLSKLSSEWQRRAVMLSWERLAICVRISDSSLPDPQNGAVINPAMQLMAGSKSMSLPFPKDYCNQNVSGSFIWTCSLSVSVSVFPRSVKQHLCVWVRLLISYRNNQQSPLNGFVHRSLPQLHLFQIWFPIIVFRYKCLCF